VDHPKEGWIGGQLARLNRTLDFKPQIKRSLRG